jgi:hypothetical protein
VQRFLPAASIYEHNKNNIKRERGTMRALSFMSLLLLGSAVLLLSACAKTPSNPYRLSDAYGAMAFEAQESVRVLSAGELHHGL